MPVGCNKRSSALLVKTYAVLISALSMLITLAPAQAKVVKTEHNPQLSSSTPVTQWRDDAQKPRAVIIAIHGLVLHGGVYDAMATDLASQGIVVIAPDLRGYGHWVNHDDDSRDNLSTPVDYKRSHADLVSLAQKIKANYPEIPFFALGESLGADMALHLAADEPAMLDGLVLSAPSVKHRWFVSDILRTAPSMISRPFRQIDLAPQIQKYFSNDSRISDAALGDPLVRKRMTALELWRTGSEANKCLKYAKSIRTDLPVLVMQGGNDQMLRGEAVTELLKALPAFDQKLEWFQNSGHLLLETRYVRPKTMSVVSNWLNKHVPAQPQVAAAAPELAATTFTTLATTELAQAP